jgi:hypothetical protein
MQKGDKVKLTELISDNHEDWYMSEREFGVVKDHVGKIGTVVHVQKHFNDSKKISYFIDVVYSSGFKLRRVNKLAFQLVEFDFDYI